jgi:hypothetical protein
VKYWKMGHGKNEVEGYEAKILVVKVKGKRSHRSYRRRL